MLRLLFESLEGILGPSLAGVSRLVYWSGLSLVAAVALLSLWRVWLDHATSRAGLAQRWVATCPACGRAGVVRGSACSHCGKPIEMPWPVRVRARGPGWRETPAVRRAARAYRLAGTALFLLLVAWTVAAAGALTPRGELHRLFLGLGLLGLAAAGRSAGRALCLERRGVIARAGDGLQALAAVGVLAVSLFLASAARPAGETVLARFGAADGAVRIGDRLLPTSHGEIGVEYVQLDHATLGYTRIVPLAFVGAERAPLPLGRIDRWLIDHLRAHADAYEARGLTVRIRSDRHQVVPGGTYEVVVTGGQLLIRRAREPAGESRPAVR